MTPRGSRVLFLCICAALVGYEGYRFYGTTAPDPPTVLIQGEQPILIPQFGDGAQLTQAFGMTADGLRAVSVQLTSDRPATLQVLCELQQTFETGRRCSRRFTAGRPRCVTCRAPSGGASTFHRWRVGRRV